MLTNLPFTLPDWMPGWVFLLLAVPILLYLLAFLVMPFSVIGVKSRIEALEAQIDSLHEDLRMMAMRSSGALPPAATSLDRYDDVPNFGNIKRSQRGYAEPALSDPLPPSATAAPLTPMRERLAVPAPTPPPRATRRTEPRLD